MVTLININEIKNNRNLVKIPKNATDITIKNLSKNQPPQNSAAQKNYFFENVRFLLADVDQAAENLVSAILPDNGYQLVDVSTVVAPEQSQVTPEQPIQPEQTDQSEVGQGESQQPEEPVAEVADNSTNSTSSDQQSSESPVQTNEEQNATSTETTVATSTASTTDSKVPPVDVQDAQPCAGADTSDCIAVEYILPAPTITEQGTDTGKLVTISAQDEVTPLTDVLAYTTIPKMYKVGQEDKIKIKWKNNGDQDMAFKAYDKNNDGYLDYVEWTVPHLSDQTFEIIFISKAFRLDADKNITEDIYPQVETQDQNFATIQDNEWLRFIFESQVSSTKNIDIYAKPTNPSQSATIEVYPVYADADGNLTEGPVG
jgi:hypothetical protein